MASPVLAPLVARAYASMGPVTLLMYYQGFRFWNMGYAAAVAFVLFLLILAFTSLQLLVGRGSRER